MRVIKKDKVKNKNLLDAIKSENIDFIKSILENLNEKEIKLKLNNKNIYGEYPLLLAISRNDIEIVKLLIEYANQHQIILELNKKKYSWNLSIIKSY